MGYTQARSLGLVSYPIADRKPVKQRQVQPKAGSRDDLTAKFAQEKMGSAEAVFRDPFAPSPLDGPPMQQVVGPQAKRTLLR